MTGTLVPELHAADELLVGFARALKLLGADALDPEAARDTLGSVIKDHDDLELVSDRLPELVDG